MQVFRMLKTTLVLTGFNHCQIDKFAPFDCSSCWTMTLINLKHFLQCFLIVCVFVVSLVYAKPTAVTSELQSSENASGELILVQAIFR